MSCTDVNDDSVCGQLVVALNVRADVRSVAALSLVHFLVLEVYLDSAAEALELAGYGHVGDGLLGKQVAYIDVDLTTHWTALHLEPTGVARDVTVATLHHRRQRDARANRALETVLHVIGQ